MNSVPELKKYFIVFNPYDKPVAIETDLEVAWVEAEFFFEETRANLIKKGFRLKECVVIVPQESLS